VCCVLRDEERDIIKEYGVLGAPDQPETSRVCSSLRKFPISGDPDDRFISASHVERQNLTMRMSMRRFTRLTNGFSKNATEPKPCARAPLCLLQLLPEGSTIKTTPAIAAGLTDLYWTVHDLARLPDLIKGEAA